MNIRRFQESDFQNLFEMLSDSDVMEYIEPVFSEEKAKDFLNKVALVERPLIYAAENDDGKFVGYVIYHDYDAVSIEIGWLLKKSEWGKGYAKELTRMMLKKVENDGKDVVIECAPEQDITKHIAESFGFKYMGIVDGCSVYKCNRINKEGIFGE